MAKEEKEIICSVLAVLNTEKPSDKSKVQIRVVSWNYGKPVLEKRPFYKKEDEWMHAKLAGFKAADFEVIEAKSAKIKKLLALEGEDAIKEAEEARKEAIAAK